MKGEGLCIYMILDISFEILGNFFICLNRISRDYGLMMQQLSGFCRLLSPYLCVKHHSRDGDGPIDFVWWLGVVNIESALLVRIQRDLFLTEYQ